MCVALRLSSAGLTLEAGRMIEGRIGGMSLESSPTLNPPQDYVAGIRWWRVTGQYRQDAEPHEVHACRRVFVVTSLLLELRGFRRLNQWPNPLAIIPDKRRPVSDRMKVSREFFTIRIEELDPGMGQVLRRLIASDAALWEDPTEYWMLFLQLWAIFQDIDTQELCHNVHVGVAVLSSCVACYLELRQL